MKRIIPLLVISLLLAGMYSVFYYLYLRKMPVETSIRVHRDESLDSIAEKMAKKGMVPHDVFVRIGARLFRVDRHIKAGYYEFNGHYNLKEILLELTTGKDRMVQVTIPEGLNHLEVFQILADHGLGTVDDFLYLFNHPEKLDPVDPSPVATLEGWLFPDTYRFSEHALPKEILSHMMIQLARQFSAIESEQRSGEVELTPLQVITLASLVEKETGAPEERPLIASVFLNRLTRNMKLDCDPTVIYALILEGRWDGNIRKRDLEMDHPYNTYRRRGLPPGPIANPGTEAIRAVLQPARTDYLFFVSRNDGTHDFSESYREHRKKVNDYQVNYWRNKRK